MNLAGYVPLSLCDFPGHIAAVIFTQGCNFRCPFCHNSHLLPLMVPPDKLLPEAEILSKLESRKNRLNSLVITGGEPTLQRDLPAFLRRLKPLGLALKLDTNGSRPEVLRTLFKERLVDFVAMDIKAPWRKYVLLAGQVCNRDLQAVQESMRLIAASDIPHQFRTTRVDPLLDERDYIDIQQQIPAGCPHVWQAFRPENCLNPALRLELPAGQSAGLIKN